MLDRIVTVLEAHADATLPTLRNLAYGGSKVALPLVRKALSTAARRRASSTPTASPRPARRSRCSPPTITATRSAASDDARRPAPRFGRPTGARHRGADPRRGRHRRSAPGETGELFVRGEQVSGRYTEIGSVLDAEGWFPTKDVAMLDDERLPVHRRPIRRHHHPRRREHRARRDRGRARRASRMCTDCAVVGAEDPEWGQIIVAVVVPADGRRPRSRRTARARPRESARIPNTRPGGVP